MHLPRPATPILAYSSVRILSDWLVQVSPPRVGGTTSLQMMVSNLDYDQHKGRMAIGRVNSGKLRKGQTVAVAKPGAHVQ